MSGLLARRVVIIENFKRSARRVSNRQPLMRSGSGSAVRLDCQHGFTLRSLKVIVGIGHRGFPVVADSVPLVDKRFAAQHNGLNCRR
jgi:hypothetical protein